MLCYKTANLELSHTSICFTTLKLNAKTYLIQVKKLSLSTLSMTLTELSVKFSFKNVYHTVGDDDEINSVHIDNNINAVF